MKSEGSERAEEASEVRPAWAWNRRCESSEDPDGGNLTSKARASQ